MTRDDMATLQREMISRAAARLSVTASAAVCLLRVSRSARLVTGAVVSPNLTRDRDCACRWDEEKLYKSFKSDQAEVCMQADLLWDRS
jgi:hypothetical protein